MAGHNKWSKVKRLKGALDQKRGKLFSKLAKEITVAARIGPGDPICNPRLKLTYLPGTTIQISDERTAAQVLRLCDALEGNNDVQSVHANIDRPETVLAKITA